MSSAMIHEPIATTVLKERPILFSGPMIRALLSGAKTQTRRAIKPQPDAVHDGEPYWNIGGYRAYSLRGATNILRMGTLNPLLCPYGKPGDRLWVRESWRGAEGMPGTLNYRATYPVECKGWRPSIHMPRWASRVSLEITDVRVERLQEISEQDARAEGCFPSEVTEGDLKDLAMSDLHPDIKAIGKALGPGQFTAKFEFSELWDSINGKTHSWHSNHWVWAITFRPISEIQK